MSSVRKMIQRDIDRSRYYFRATQRGSRESFESYVGRLKKLLAECEYADPDSHLREQLIYDAIDLRARALYVNMSLEGLISMGIFLDTKCTRCGSSSHKSNSRLCKARDEVCSLCHKRGHFSCYCLSQERLFESDDRQPSTSQTSQRSQWCQSRSQESFKQEVHDVELDNYSHAATGVLKRKSDEKDES